MQILRKQIAPGVRMKFSLVTLALILTGCASGYTKFYQPIEGVDPAVVAARRVAPPPDMPLLERSNVNDGEAQELEYAKRGYRAIGTASFNSGHTESETEALKQGKAVGADLVLVINPQYTGSVTSSVPLTTPTSQTSYTTGSATAYGPGGTATAYGNATTTTYGSKTTYIPMTVHRSDYFAVFFIKTHSILGAVARELSDTERQALGSNKGAYVSAVVNDSPAFRSDILAGDVVISVDGQQVGTRDSFYAMLERVKGKVVEVVLNRRGETIKKSIQMNNF